MSRRGLVLGAGGTVGHAWILAALRRLETATGWDPRSASVLVGTSAGSVIATRLAAGQSVAEQIAASGKTHDPHIPPRPRGGPQSLRLFGRGLLGKVPPLAALTGLLPAGRGERFELARGVPLRIDHPACWVVAMDVDSGERVVFGRDQAASYADAVAASCAVPGWVEPVTIGGRRYLDGGALSATSADLVLHEVDEAIIVSPMTSARFARPGSLGQAAERLLRVALSRILAREVAALEEAGVRVIRIEPTAHELRLLGANFMDARRAAHVLS